MKSKLDPSIYGSPESAITDEIVEQQIKGFMSVDEVITSICVSLRLTKIILFVFCVKNLNIYIYIYNVL